MYVVVEEKSVFHFGEADRLVPIEGRNWLYEGNSFSVSLCPKEWLRIAQHSSNKSALYEISRSDGKPATFVDLSRLSERNIGEIDTWCNSNLLGTFAAPNLTNLSDHHKTRIDGTNAKQALLFAWAMDRPVDGIWYSEPISLNDPESSRGGIFQNRIHDFQSKKLSEISERDKWPAIRLPTIYLKTL